MINISHSAHSCDFKDCPAVGVYPAPQSTKHLRQYYWFCLQHIRQYNAAWNFNGDLNVREMENYRHFDFVGQRPTWKREAFVTGVFYENFIKNFSVDQVLSKIVSDASSRNLGCSVEERKALNFFQLTEIFDTEPVAVVKAALKRQYYFFVKKYHPDYNKGCKKAENQLKKVIINYRLLKKKIEDLSN